QVCVEHEMMLNRNAGATEKSRHLCGKLISGECRAGTKKTDNSGALQDARAEHPAPAVRSERLPAPVDVICLPGGYERGVVYLLGNRPPHDLLSSLPVG